MANFNVIEKTFIDNRLYEPGDVVSLDIKYDAKTYPALVPAEAQKAKPDTKPDADLA